MGETRDYYADLELPPTADIAEVKKQFRKLEALKYHPDRNPGKEQEVNAKFQIIQSANEILGDPTEKAKYDASYTGRTSRYPTASGRKGNPWSEAAQHFPPPPRRNPPGDPETKKNAAKAFDTMRKSQAKKPQAKPEPPPPPPRTQTGRERAEASFGTRKAQPNRPPTEEQDPSYRKPAPQHYDVGSQPQPPMPDPLSQFRDNAAQSNSRYSSQYTTHGGEKIDPFEGMQRTPSMRNTGNDAARRSRADDSNNGSAGAYAKPSFQKQAQHSGSTDSTRPQPDTESIFNFKVDDDAFHRSDSSRSPSRPRPTHQSSFDKTNVDDINTKFSKEFGNKLWNFTAGSPTSDKPGVQQPDTEPPNSKQSNIPHGSTIGATEAAAHETGFNPGGWSDKFGPQTFVPQQAPAASASPTRASRTNSRKNKPVKSNANNPIVIENTDEEDLYAWPGRNTYGQGQSTDSPQEMDIDTPPAVPPRPPPSARDIYVEPTRPEWRSDEAQATAGNSVPGVRAANSSTPHVGGSEDSEEFIASFEDLKNVAPFSEQKAGLKSFHDLKDNLPFESKASGEVPLQIPKVQPLVFPTPPIAPRPPPTVAIESVTPSDSSWNKYLDDFGMYLQEWELFNTQVVDHFATRNAHIKRDRESKGYAFLGSRSENEIQEYISWVQQDNDVRRRWNAACEGHEERFREFMAFRNRMKKKN
ncbi:Heat shock protein DnaJ [Cordyceps javanica]|uniref:Heat shock protein DnaJ n=1 Tax=Cordyceps javanica TaxID=43265 RepID=A0A545VAG6_9HYPO|nr:Heat shock protein DnaJ [Cordyceps javanica]TQW09937.1 Heat shock protein DnaJ [Cordyceps javanica]